MQHVHWWLFALSFFLGLALTFMLLKKSRPAVESEPPTTKIVVAEEPQTTKIRVVEEPPTTKIRVVAEEPPTTKIPVVKEAPTTKIPVVTETPTQKIPTVPFAPYGPGSARAGAEGGGPARSEERRVGKECW